jgi:hypothetical protein
MHSAATAASLNPAAFALAENHNGLAEQDNLKRRWELQVWSCRVLTSACKQHAACLIYLIEVPAAGSFWDMPLIARPRCKTHTSYSCALRCAATTTHGHFEQPGTGVLILMRWPGC